MRPEQWCIGLLLFSGLLCSAEIKAETLTPPVVTFSAKRLTLHHRSSIREGAWVSETATLGLFLDCTAVADHAVVAISDCTIDTAVVEIADGATHDVRRPEAPKVWDGIRWWAEAQGLTGERTTLTANLNLDLKPPPPGAKRRLRITGSVHVLVATSAEREIDIPGTAPRTAVGLDWIEPQSHAWSFPAIRCSAGLTGRLVHLELLTPDPDPKPQRGGFSGVGQADGEGMATTLSIALRPTDVVRLTFVDGITDSLVPFTIGPIDLGVLDHD